MREVLRDLKDLPEGLANRLVKVVESNESDRPDAIRKVFEELARD